MLKICYHNKKNKERAENMSTAMENATTTGAASETVEAKVDGKTLETEEKILETKTTIDDKKPKFFEAIEEKLNFDYTKEKDNILMYKANFGNYNYQITSQAEPSKLWTLAIQHKREYKNCMAMANLGFIACKFIANIHARDKGSRTA